jgi:hypothetical protein
VRIAHARRKAIMYALKINSLSIIEEDIWSAVGEVSLESKELQDIQESGT